MSELQYELSECEPWERASLLNPINPNKPIEPKRKYDTATKISLRKSRLKEVLAKNPSRHQNMIDFCYAISATPQSANSFKHIYTMKSSRSEPPKLMMFYNQSVHLDLRQNSYNAKIGFDDIRIITFHKYLDWYITKNSFVGNIRRTENLFSFDNIVIDVDNHSNIKRGDLNKQIRLLMKCLREKEIGFPEFNVVYTGRGVQIWIGLVSFTARKDSMKKLYFTFCEELCNIVKSVIESNSINLDVDEAASKDMCRIVRLPYTFNTKVKRKTIFIKYTGRRYTVDELCSRFGIQRADKSKQKEIKSKQNRINYNMGMGFAPLFAKRMNFIERIVDDCNGDCIGRRELLLHHYFNICRQVFDDDEALAMTEELNMQFSESLPSSTLSALAREKIYKYKTKTFLSSINATFAEQKLYSDTTGRQSERDKAKKVKEERNNKIVELREKGYTQQRIADTVNCHVDTVADVLHKYKWQTVINAKDTRDRSLIKQKFINMKLVKRRDIEKPTIELYKRGYKQKDIAKNLGIAESTVSNILKPYKQQMVSRRNRQIIELAKQGINQQQIADEVGCTRQTVSKVFNEYKKNQMNVPEQVEKKPVTHTVQQRQLSTDENITELLKTKLKKSFVRNSSKEVEEYERNEINDDS